LTAYLTRPLQWAQTTRSLWAPSFTASPVVDEISIVGRGARGLGIAIDREIGEARRLQEQETRALEGVLPGAAGSTGKVRAKYARTAGSTRRRAGASVFPNTADRGRGETDGVRVVEYDFVERR
jgi:hypothetical protein